MNQSLRELPWKRIGALAAIALFAVFFRSYFIAVSLTAATAVVAFFVNEFDLRFAGVELATFSTVVLGMMFGPVPGAAAGVFLVMIQLVVGQQVGPYMVWVVPTYGAVGLVAGVLSLPISQLGLYLTLGMHAVFLTCTAVFTPQAVSKFLPYSVGNVVLNAALFTAVAPQLPL